MHRRSFFRSVARRIAGRGHAVWPAALPEECSRVQGEIRKRPNDYPHWADRRARFHPLQWAGSTSDSQATTMTRQADSCAIRMVASNFMDNPGTFTTKGQSEVRWGKALKDGYRKKVSDDKARWRVQRRGEQADQRIATALAEPTTLDLIQHHEISLLTNPDRIFAERGASR